MFNYMFIVCKFLNSTDFLKSVSSQISHRCVFCKVNFTVYGFINGLLPLDFDYSRSRVRYC